MICQEEDIVRYAVVEKANHRAVHEVFDTRERAEAFIAGIIPLYVAHGLYVDKTLRPCARDPLDRATVPQLTGCAASPAL